MTTAVGEFRSAIRRGAICTEIGEFRPPESPTTSCFGRAGFALLAEDWPSRDGKPMHALCQVNLTELPFRPPRLDDLEFIAVFVGTMNCQQTPLTGRIGASGHIGASINLCRWRVCRQVRRSSRSRCDQRLSKKTPSNLASHSQSPSDMGRLCWSCGGIERAAEQSVALNRATGRR
jgi:hypothetical protein